MLSFFITLILIISMTLLSLPLWRKSSVTIPIGAEAADDQERVDLEIEKNMLVNSLVELDVDLGQGKFKQADYDRMKAADERRLVTLLERLEELTKKRSVEASHVDIQKRPQSGALKWVTSLSLSVLVAGSAVGIYSYILSEHKTKQSSAQGGAPMEGMPDPKAMVAQLEARLKENPNDLEGQIMAGRSYMALRRVEDAKKAWNKVLELKPRHEEGHFNLGVILLQETPPSDKSRLDEILNHFTIAEIKLPREPVLLWHKGVTLVRLERYSEADESWTGAFQNLMPGSEDAEFVKEALQNLRAGKPPLF